MYRNKSSFWWTKDRTMDYIPLPTTDYKMAFCKAINDLPEEVKVKIWNLTNQIDPPPAPTKKMPPRLVRHMDRWAARRKLTF